MVYWRKNTFWSRQSSLLLKTRHTSLFALFLYSCVGLPKAHWQHLCMLCVCRRSEEDPVSGGPGERARGRELLPGGHTHALWLQDVERWGGTASFLVLLTALGTVSLNNKYKKNPPIWGSRWPTPTLSPAMHIKHKHFHEHSVLTLNTQFPL